MVGYISSALSGPDAGIYRLATLCLIAGGVVAAVLVARHSRAQANAAREYELAQARREAEDAETRRQERWRALVDRFGEPSARRVWGQELWQGATSAMVIEAFGHPADISESVLKSRTKQVFKYGPLGRGRFTLKVQLENDIVVGWDKDA